MANYWQNQNVDPEVLGFVGQLTVGLAVTDEDRRACQALLAIHRAAPRLGARRCVAQFASVGVTENEHHDYLAVWDNLRDRVVAAADLIPARHTYAPSAFELGAHFELRPLVDAYRNVAMELSHIVVDPSYRADGNALQLLLKGIAASMDLNGIDRVITSVAVTRKLGDSYLFSLLDTVRRANDGREMLPLRPWLRLPSGDDIVLSACRMPSVLKYLMRIGAYVHPEPAWDALNNSVVFAVVIDRKRVNRDAWKQLLRV